MKKQYEVQIELYNTQIKRTQIHYYRGDENVYPITIKLTQDFEPFAIPEDAKAFVGFKRSDGVADKGEAEIIDHQNGIVEYTLRGSEISVVGTTYANVEIHTETERLSFPPFTCEVEQNIDDNGAQPPEAYKDWTRNIEDQLRALAQQANWDGANGDDWETEGGQPVPLAGSADAVSFDNSTAQLPNDPENVQKAIEETAKQISNMSVIPKPTKETQIIISRKKADGTLEEIQADFAQAKALPVSDFTVAKQAEKWAKRVAPYPSDLVAYIDFDGGNLVPKVGNFALSGTPSYVDGYYDKGVSVPAMTNALVANAKVVPLGAKTIRIKAKTGGDVNTDQKIISTILSSGSYGVRVDIVSGNIYWYVMGNNTYYAQAPIQSNTDYDMIFAFTGTTEANGLKIYLNGTLAGQSTFGGGEQTSSYNLHIGKHTNDTAQFLGKYIDEIEIYNTVKTPADFSKDSAYLKLDWKRPTNTFFTQDTIIRRSDEGYPTSITDGELVTETTAESFVDTIADTSKNQYYSAFGNNGIVASNAVSTEYKPEPGYLMLYDAGDECVNVTGGWETSQSGFGPYIKRPNSFYITRTGGATCSTSSDISTINLINIKNYKNFKAKITSSSSVSASGSPSMQSNFYSVSNNRIPGYPTTGVVVSCQDYIQGQNNTSFSGVRSDTLNRMSTLEQAYASFYISRCDTGGTQTQTMEVFNVWLEKDDDWQTWVSKAGLNSSSYANLDAVVSSQSTMQTLANSTSAVDYMITCTGTIMGAVTNSVIAMTEIGKSSYAMDKIVVNEHWTKFILMHPNAIAGLDASNPITVPTMTSNTTPSGIATATSSAYLAFDKNFSDGNNRATGDYLTYEFANPLWVYKVKLYGAKTDGSYSTISYYDVYVGDGTNFIKIISNYAVNVEQIVDVIPTSHVGRHKVIKFVLIQNNNSYSTGSKRYYEENCYGK